MAIPTSRTKVKGTITIDDNLCNGCGLCVSVCKDFSLEMIDGTARETENPLFGCIACGHCMAICPTDAIAISGRFLSKEDLFELPPKEKAAGYSELESLFERRRSIREFRDRPVEKELLSRILCAASTAPMGLPPSDVHTLVLDGKDKVRHFSREFCEYLEGMKWLVSPWFMFLMRPFWGRASAELFRDFVRPLIHRITEDMEKGINNLTYDAPLAVYFYASPYADPADPIIAATYAMLAAESLGLGTCMIGSIHPLIQNGKKARAFREAQGIRFAGREGLFVLFGYPRVAYKKGIRRTFASMQYS